MTFQEMAWEFVDVFENLDNDQINQMLAKNVPYETLEFAAKYNKAHPKLGLPPTPQARPERRCACFLWLP